MREPPENGATFPYDPPMAITATIYHLKVTLSDVERGVYEALDLRLARHPSESMRYLVTRLLAYCLSYEEGIAFSKGGLSTAEEPPIALYDLTGVLVAWIDVGSPSAERMHRASKAARRVDLFTHADLALLKREAATRAIHKLEELRVFRLATSFLDEIAEKLERSTKIEVVRNGEQIYVTIGSDAIEGELSIASLVD